MSLTPDPPRPQADERSKQRKIEIIGTPLTATTYDELVEDLIESWRVGEPRTLSFCNTYMVTKRRVDSHYRAVTRVCDTNVPDGMPLVWCMNGKGGGLHDRVYGPIFMQRFLQRSPAAIRHFFVGGDENCLQLLRENARTLNPKLQLVGAHHGYFTEAEEKQIIDELTESKADLVWVGLGTPKQDEWVARHRSRLGKAILLPVGSSFEFLAGTKAAPPLPLQRLGLTWLFRLCSEPRRLGPRYLKWNLLFLVYLARDSLLGTPQSACSGGSRAL